MDNSELDSFRRRWKEEVSARSKPQSSSENSARTPQPNAPGRPVSKVAPPVATRPHTKSTEARTREDDELGTSSFHDLEDKNDYLRLGSGQERSKAGTTKEPTSALEHYERAVERETQGSLGDSVNHYRKAFKLDAQVQETYKKKHFPHAMPPTKSSNPNPSNAPPTVPGTAHASLHGGASSTLNELLDEFSKLSIPPAEPETSISLPRPCPLATIPEEVLAEIILTTAITDVASLVHLSQACKRLAYLTISEERVWKRLALGAEFGFAAMHYRYACDLYGRALHASTAPLARDLTPSAYATYRAQFRRRPRIRFGGAYISTVNYTRPGGATQSTYTWNNPVHIVTYYRYLRFFRDGRALSLLTTAEPADVVHHLTFDNAHTEHAGGLPSAVMKDALIGRWRLSGCARGTDEPDGAEEPDSTLLAAKGPGEYVVEPLGADADGEESEGDVHVETEGVIPKYMYKMQFGFGSAGRRDAARNNKLTWKGFWSYNRLTDDWSEFMLKNDRAFYWSRVKSYGLV